jgi:hypothetical protein
MAGDYSLFDDPRHRRFYERMVPVMLESNWLRFSVLRWQGEVLAYHLGFLFDGVFTWYKPTFNVDWARYSPGEVLLKCLLEDALANDVRVFDFTVGDEAFKERFANVKNQNVRIGIARRAQRGVRERVGDGVKRHVKTRHPRLFAELKRAQTSLQATPPVPDTLGVVSTFEPGGTVPRPRAESPLRVVSRILWRASPLQPVPSEFGAQWARYSHLKTFTRREGLHQHFLFACLEKLRRGERAVVVTWQDRPVALVWLARDAGEALGAHGFTAVLPDGAAVVTDSYMALDLRGSPRRETLPATLVTFLAAEGVTALFGVQDTRHPAPVLAQCGGQLLPLVRRMEFGFCGWRTTREHGFVED